MKKLIFHLFMSILLIVSVSACGSSSDLENKNKAVKEDKKLLWRRSSPPPSTTKI
ncbi:hypothetical protein [Peribacillus frigoritolerans]|uniref:hypothetical protein n=1 Tax=Peribacillus frigoritolerans TaxID=450367 RepID=UPI0025A15E70|nr:hypothetical protein [Peribacillus frigoritolerans]MDM5305165.1 hypothetical protein [Peribacillus frigoritolerans]